MSTDKTSLENENQSSCLGAVMPHLFFVVARNSEETWQQITQGLDSYEKAKNYRDSDFCKKQWKYAFVVCTIDEA